MPRSSKLNSRYISWRRADRTFSLGAGHFILRGLTTIKICHMPSYVWAMVTEIVHQLKLLQLSKFDDRSPTMARVMTIFQRRMTRSNYVTST